MSIADRLDRLPVTALHIAALVVATLGVFTDIAEVALGNTFSAVLAGPPFDITRGELSLLLAAVFAGGAVGAPLLGAMADRYGRKLAMQAALVVLCVSSLAVAFSRDVTTMTLLRFVSGLALGGYPPLTIAYLSDLMPPRRRGLLTLGAGAFAYLGAPLIIFFIRWTTPVAPLGLEGWRWALLLGSFCSLLGALLYVFVPESPRWLASVGRNKDAARECARFESRAGLIANDDAPLPASPVDRQRSNGFRALLRDPIALRYTLLLVALFMLMPWATIGFPLLSAAVMAHKGFQPSESLLFAALSMVGPPVGIATFSLFVDRLPRRLTLVGCAVVMIVDGIAFALATSLNPLILLGFVFNLTCTLFGSVLAIYGAELVATHLRASATAAAWSCGRLVSALVPMVLLPLLQLQGPLAMFALISAVLLTAIVLLVVAGPSGREGQPVA